MTTLLTTSLLRRARRNALPALATLLLTATVIAGRAASDVPALAPHVPGVVLVAFHEQAPLQARASVVQKYKLTVDTRSASPYFAEFHVPKGASGAPVSVRAMLQALSREPSVRIVEPDYLLFKKAVPNDPRFSEQYAHRNAGQTGGISGADIGSVAAWDTSVGSDSVVVAVIDTGVDYNHPDLTDNILRDNQGNVVGFDYFDNDRDPMDPDGHGTHVAGIIGARGNNGIGVTGVCQRVKIMPLRFLGSNGGATSDAIKCIDFASQRGVRISNNSWGGGGGGQLLLDAILRARSANQLFVTAAGNGGSDGVGDDNDQVPNFPGNFRLQADNVVNVAATDANDQLGSFSNFGLTTVDIGAPGVQILSTTPDNKYELFNGTSMASPMVAGAAALIRANAMGLNYLQLKQVIIDNLQPIPALQGRTVTGGRLDITRALLSIRVTAPNGGERLKVGATLPITWTSVGVPPTSNVKIELSRGTGAAFTETIVASTPNTGSYDWVVTGPANDLCRVKITTLTGEVVSDEGDSTFRIIEGTLTVDTPNDGEVAILGTVLPITWTTTGFAGPTENPTVAIELSEDGGFSWRTLFSSTRNDGSEDWIVSGTPTFDALIRVSLRDNPEFSDESDDVFEIRKPSSVTVTYPNGGEQLVDGREIAIQWSTTGRVTDVRIELSRNGGVSWETLFPSTPNETNEPDRGEVFWTVRGPFTRLARIRVTDLDVPTASDTSNGVFEIQVPGLRVTSPVAGQRVLVGQEASITWTSDGIDANSDVAVELSRDGGDTWEEIAFTANFGLLDWQVEGDETANAIIRITSLDDPGVFAHSQQFSILEPTLALTSPNGREGWRVGRQEIITWSGTCVGQGRVEIQLNRNYPRGAWETIIRNTPNDGGEAWGVRGKLSKRARVRIIWSSDTAGDVEDESDANFRILKASRGKRRR